MKNVLNKLCSAQRQKAGFLIFATLSLVITIIIFLLSSQTAKESSKLSGSVQEIPTEVIENILDEVKTEKKESLITWFENWFRKIAHILLFFAYGFSLCGTFLNITAIKRFYLKPILAFLIGAVYSVLDELHQFFVEGRSAEFLDVGFDLLGIVAGVLIMLVIYGIVVILKKRQKSALKSSI